MGWQQNVNTSRLLFLNFVVMCVIFNHYLNM
uniref:Uncharacterized protein n=1 Tax=Anguilla anguilla TaxID=7936 RepID=A0A0E9XIN9_ANGAN